MSVFPTSRGFFLTALQEEHPCDGKKLRQPWRTPDGPKKFAVCVSSGGEGKRKVVRFGDPSMEIKRDDPEDRKNFRARHNCDDPGPEDKARYWSCKMWQKGKSVGDMTSEGETGLWDRIRAKRRRGEPKAKPGDEDYPDPKAFKKAQESLQRQPLSIHEAGSPVPVDWPRRVGSNPPPGVTRREAYPAGKLDRDADFGSGKDAKKLAKALAWIKPSRRAAAGGRIFKT